MTLNYGPRKQFEHSSIRQEHSLPQLLGQEVLCVRKRQPSVSACLTQYVSGTAVHLLEGRFCESYHCRQLSPMLGPHGLGILKSAQLCASGVQNTRVSVKQIIDAFI